MIFWLKYGTQADIRFPMVKRGVVDLAVSADWTPASTDASISKDGGNTADTTNTVAAITGGGTRSSAMWKLTLTATEMQAAEIDVQIVDAATKAVEDQFLTIYTYGNASAKFAGDWSDLVRMGLTALPNAAAEAAGGLYTRGTGAGQIKQTNNGEIDSNTTHINNVATSSVTTINANVGTTQPINFTGTAGSALVKVDAIDLAGQTITAAAGVTFPSSVASPTNITAGTITNVTTVNGFAADSITAAALAADAVAEIQSGLSTYAGGDTAGTTTLLSRLTAIRAGNLDNLDVVLSTRLASASYTAPDNASITAIKLQTDKFTFTVANVVDANIQYVNDVQVNGDGSVATPWGP